MFILQYRYLASECGTWHNHYVKYYDLEEAKEDWREYTKVDDGQEWRICECNEDADFLKLDSYRVVA